MQAGAPVALSSDAHRPEDVGADYDRALEVLGRAGVGELCVFEHRRRRMAAIAGAGAEAQPSGPAARPRPAGAGDQAGARSR